MIVRVVSLIFGCSFMLLRHKILDTMLHAFDTNGVCACIFLKLNFRHLQSKIDDVMAKSDSIKVYSNVYCIYIIHAIFGILCIILLLRLLNTAKCDCIFYNIHELIIHRVQNMKWVESEGI